MIRVMRDEPIDIAFMLSGGGSTLENLMTHIKDGVVDARIRLVISSDPGAYGLERAERHDLPSTVVNPDEYEDRATFSRAITRALDRVDPDLVCMGGFMHFYQIPEKYRYRVINIHPSLLPKYGGPGFYGHHVHEAVLEAREDETGCSVHFATNAGYDEGPVILQKTVPVRPEDTPERLEERVREKEREAYPEAVQLFAEGRVRVEDDKVVIEEGS